MFRAEFVAMKIGMETLQGLRYILRMMGIPLSGTLIIYGYNMAVIHNMQGPENTLRQRIISLCYHAIRESFAMGESLTEWVPTVEILHIFLLNICMDQSRDIWCGIYCMISTMSIRN